MTIKKESTPSGAQSNNQINSNIIKGNMQTEKFIHPYHLADLMKIASKIIDSERRQINE